MKTQTAEVKEGTEILVNKESGKLAIDSNESITRNLSPEEQEIKIKEMNALVDEKTNALNEFKEKVYLVGNKETANSILFFIENYAQWKYNEAIGILEIEKIINGKLAELKKSKKDQLFLRALDLEGIYYFLRNSGGTGKLEAKEYVENVTPIIHDIVVALNTAANERKVIEESINQARLDLASAEQGIEVLVESVNKD